MQYSVTVAFFIHRTIMYSSCFNVLGCHNSIAALTFQMHIFLCTDQVFCTFTEFHTPSSRLPENYFKNAFSMSNNIIRRSAPEACFLDLTTILIFFACFATIIIPASSQHETTQGYSYLCNIIVF